MYFIYFFTISTLLPLPLSSGVGGHRKGPSLYDVHAMDEEEEEAAEQSQAQRLFKSLQTESKAANPSAKRGSDGSLPLPGFSFGVRAVLPPTLFPGPKVPADYQPIHRFDAPASSESCGSDSGMTLAPKLAYLTAAHGGYRPAVELPMQFAAPPTQFGRAAAAHTAAAIAPASSWAAPISASERGRLLGETPLPGAPPPPAATSVFDMLPESAKIQMSSYLAKSFVVAGALNMAADGFSAGINKVEHVPEPTPAPMTALLAGGGSMGLAPSVVDRYKADLLRHFGDDIPKHARLAAFVEEKTRQMLNGAGEGQGKGSTLALSTKHSASAFTEHMTQWQIQQEQREFEALVNASSYGAHLSAEAARLDREAAERRERQKHQANLEAAGATDYVAAAKMKMFGKLTRMKEPWRPERLLCKRFNVAEPVVQDLPPPSIGTGGAAGGRGAATPFAPSAPAVSSFMQKTDALFVAAGLKADAPPPPPQPLALSASQQAAVDAEEANRPIAKPERPPMDLFKAIFEDDEDDTQAASVAVRPNPPPPLVPAPPSAAGKSVLTAIFGDDDDDGGRVEIAARSAPPAPSAPPRRPQSGTGDLLSGIFGKGEVLSVSLDTPSLSAHGKTQRAVEAGHLPPQASAPSALPPQAAAAAAIAARINASLVQQRAMGQGPSLSSVTAMPSGYSGVGVGPPAVGATSASQAMQFLSNLLPPAPPPLPPTHMQPTPLQELVQARCVSVIDVVVIYLICLYLHFTYGLLHPQRQ
jgi:hypothetical protein